MTLARRETAYQTFYDTALCRQKLACTVLSPSQKSIGTKIEWHGIPGSRRFTTPDEIDG